MATATTTLGAIRDGMDTAIAAISPTSIASVPFEQAQGEISFEDWATQNPSACFRRYQWKDITDYEPPEVSNSDVEFERAQLELRVAYPKFFGMYGEENIQDAEDVIREDMYAIDAAIGHNGSANAVSGQNGAVALSKTIEDGLESVLYLTMVYETYFYRSV